MINLDLVVDRLATHVDGLVEVGQADSLADVATQNPRFPSAYVIPLQERAGPNRFQTGHIIDQQVVSRFGLLIFARAVGARATKGAFDDIEALRPRIVTALGQWIMPVSDGTADGGVRHVQGRLISNIGTGGKMSWQDDFEVTWDRRIAAEEAA